MNDIEVIRQRVESDGVLVTALDTRLSDAGLKQQLRLASLWLDDVENVFLRSARTEQRSPDALARWLSYTAFPLQMAQQKRKEIEAIVEKFGTNAQSVGG
jgi:hypothetical protein